MRPRPTHLPPIDLESLRRQARREATAATAVPWEVRLVLVALFLFDLGVLCWWLA
jgi:hypothetical protein